MRIKNFHGNDPHFAAFFLEAFGLERFDAATSVPTLNRNSVHSLPIALPPGAEQHAIVATVTTIERRVDRERDQLAKLSLLKQGPMDDLLTGRVGVTDLLQEAAK